MKWQNWSFVWALLFVVAQAGCNGANRDADGGGHDDGHAEHGDHDEHDHPEEGPQGGEIIELGKGEVHGEILHDDDTHQVTLYLWDGKLEQAAFAAVDSVRINVVVEGAAGSYPLEAVSAADGKASQFQIVSEPLTAALDNEAENITRRLSLTIDGKSYTAELESHDHDDDH